jgi:glutathione peroxidase
MRNTVKYILAGLVLLPILFAFTSLNKGAKNLHQFKISALTGGKTIDMAQFKGKYILCVNVASYCGYTKQYTALINLQKRYGSKLVVIGFPCNQFGEQEPGTPSEISNFCKKTYGVNFLLTEKIDVKGNAQHSIYKWLTDANLNQKESHEVKWNFNKFLIDPSGNWLAYFPSAIDPLDDSITQYLK